MHTCCPNCSSSSALGNEAASVCAECLSVSVAGVSLPVGTIVISALVTGVLLAMFKTLRNWRLSLAQAHIRTTSG